MRTGWTCRSARCLSACRARAHFSRDSREVAERGVPPASRATHCPPPAHASAESRSRRSGMARLVVRIALLALSMHRPCSRSPATAQRTTTLVGAAPPPQRRKLARHRNRSRQATAGPRCAPPAERRCLERSAGVREAHRYPGELPRKLAAAELDSPESHLGSRPTISGNEHPRAQRMLCRHRGTQAHREHRRRSTRSASTWPACRAAAALRARSSRVYPARRQLARCTSSARTSGRGRRAAAAAHRREPLRVRVTGKLATSIIATCGADLSRSDQRGGRYARLFVRRDPARRSRMNTRMPEQLGQAIDFLDAR